MKKVLLLSLVVSFVLLGAQAFASPPVAPPVEGFIITSFTDIDCDGDVTESENFDWTYFEGWGKGVFYPNGYVPAGCVGTGCPEGGVSELGFTEGAQIAYQQNFKAFDGVTKFVKNFAAYSNPPAGTDNLVVTKDINFTPNDPTKSYASHEEKVGLSVISMGAKDSAGNPASGLLTLCPWAADGNGTTGGGYPPTNEGIAAGSSFKVSEIQGFTSKSNVNSTVLPMLAYEVSALQGTGQIAAGFVVELWEGPKGFVWGPTESETCPGCFLLPDQEPPLASRTSYSEHATADGTWSFTKKVKYQSVMPAGATNGTFPFNQVP